MRGTTRTKSARIRTVTARVDDEVEGVSGKVARVDDKIAKRETESPQGNQKKENGLWECLRLREPMAWKRLRSFHQTPRPLTDSYIVNEI